MTISQQPFSPQPGDVVQLKSGGYQMTVRRQAAGLCVSGNGMYSEAICDWHSEEGKPCSCSYAIVMLMPAVDEDESE